MAKRANGEGTIRKRSDGRWEGRYYDPIDNKQKSIYRKTQKEVREELDKVAVDKDVGKFVSKTDMTLDEWFEFYVKTYKEGYIKPQSVSVLRYTYKSNIQPYIGEKKIVQITEADIRHMYRQWSCDHTQKTADQAKGYLTSILEQAVKSKAIKENVTKNVKLPKCSNESQKKRELTDNELYWFFRGLKEYRNTDMLYFEMLLTTGARRGELMALQWKDISEDFSFISINETYVEYYETTTGKSTSRMNTPKTETSNRIIPIHKSVQHQLQQAKETARFVASQFGREFAENDYIFIDNQTGECVSYRYVDCVIRSVKHYLKKSYNIDLIGMSSHYFRHTFASKGLREGISLETMKELLGHSDYGMISKIYAHSSNVDKEQAISTMFPSSVQRSPLGSDCGQIRKYAKF